MSVRLSCIASGSRAEMLGQILGAAGAHAVAFEEVPGGPAFYDEGLAAEPRYWPHTAISAFFTHEAAAHFAQRVIAGEVWALHEEPVADEGWEALTSRTWQAFPVTPGLWIYPNHEEAPPGRLAVHLDPGLAFGTGTHPTTRLCLRWLYEALQAPAQAPRKLLDFGCGSGILAIAALRMGARAATCIDIDPLALAATRDNAQRNGVAQRLRTAPDLAADDGPYDLVVANILAGPLIAQAGALMRAAAPQGRIALSGILPDQAPAVVRAFAGWALSAREDEGWVLLEGLRS
ncbi:50S ribosomal protein L11 methyltransferase [Acidiferrobacter sp.]|uniref:50S ribosomal protein L11 methyltransferase n=1 Tax=Acidiferrobacter sp. TaxID=1872107 RepID=UPI00260E0E88|nr:50S ribosomal protein L11 methyltransferase [Acidiferrobacter sp.]